MDILTLPAEKGWALAYPDPRTSAAHLLHVVCGWKSANPVLTDLWAWKRLIDQHECTGGAR